MIKKNIRRQNNAIIIPFNVTLQSVQTNLYNISDTTRLMCFYLAFAQVEFPNYYVVSV